MADDTTPADPEMTPEAAMREALQPFAAMAALYDPVDGDDDQDAWAYGARPTIGQLRAARAVLSTLPPAETDAASIRAADIAQAKAEGMREAVPIFLKAADPGPLEDGSYAQTWAVHLQIKGAKAVHAAANSLAIPQPTPEPQGWRPIATAPRDGTKVDLWVPRHGRVCDVCWCSSSPSSPHGAWVYDLLDWHREVGLGSPTHWMPLPAALMTGEGE